MIKEVQILLSGMHIGPEKEKIVQRHKGEYYKKNANHYILYEEAEDEVSTKTKNVIKITEHGMELTRRGTVNVHMLFEEAKTFQTVYQTPFGPIMLGIETKKIEITEQDGSIRVLAIYDLEIDGEHQADCRIELEVKDRA